MLSQFDYAEVDEDKSATLEHVRFRVRQDIGQGSVPYSCLTRKRRACAWHAGRRTATGTPQNAPEWPLSLAGTYTHMHRKNTKRLRYAVKRCFYGPVRPETAFVSDTKAARIRLCTRLCVQGLHNAHFVPHIREKGT